MDERAGSAHAIEHLASSFRWNGAFVRFPLRGVLCFLLWVLQLYRDYGLRQVHGSEPSMSTLYEITEQHETENGERNATENRYTRGPSLESLCKYLAEAAAPNARLAAASIAQQIPA